MATKRIKWNSLLRHADLQFDPDEPKQLVLTDEVIQTISWLTGATRQDRRLIRCTEHGALLVADAWCGLNSVETDELYPQSATPDSFTPTQNHSGVLIASSTSIVKISFLRKAGGSSEHYYVPPNSYYWYPYKVYSITATTVPAVAGPTQTVGVTLFI